VNCAKCGAENSSDRRFCADCGAALAQVCAGCGFHNQAAAKFCGGCGQPLDAASAASEAPARIDPPATPDLGGERRQVTILFADIAGFTQLSTALDAEELHGLVSRFFEAADGVIERYGGTVDKHMGDAVMALFGAPIAHGDDPLRAVRAAFDIHEAMAALSADADRDLQVHVGIASGEVVAGGLGREARAEYTVLGESVNLASRLDSMAGAGETLISDAVYRAVSGHVDCEALGEAEVKGLDRPVRVWRVRGLQNTTADSLRGPLVGRQGELRQFRGVIESCRDTGHGQAVLVRGEAGIGKTRLVEELTAMAEAQGFASHRGLVFDFGVGKGQDAIRALVRSLLEIPAGADKEERQAAARRALADGALDEDQGVFLNDLLDLPQPMELRGIYDAMDNPTRNRGKQRLVTRLIEGASARQPILVTVEDVHWAEPLTLAHLAAMTATVCDCPAVLVMTSRIEGDPLDSAWRGTTQGSPLLTIDLGPLRQKEALEFADRFIDATNRTAQNCVERAEGNPLFLEQLLRNAEESGDETVPASIQSLVQARMDRLAAKDKQALQAASVIGQRCGLEPLRHLIGDGDYGCAALIEHYLVRPEGGDYLFAHALVQEGAYSSLLKARKRELHLQAAGWFAGQDPALRAQHLDRAEDPGAPRAYLEAAEAQAAAFHYERALSLIERGVALANAPADQFALTCAKGQILHDLGSIPESIEACKSAIELATDDAERCRALIGLAAGMRIIDQYDDAFAALDDAEAAASHLGLTLELAQVHHIRGNLYFPLGKIEDCRKEHGISRNFAREAQSPEAEARALSGLADAEYARGRMITAYNQFQRCVELCREHGFGRIEVANLPMLGFTGYFHRTIEFAVEDCLAAVEAAQRVGHHRAELLAQSLGYYTFFELGDMDRVKAYIEKAQALVRRLGARRFEAQNLVWKARVMNVEGQQPEALKLLEQALEISRKTGIGFNGARVFSSMAFVTDDPDRQRSALEEGESILRAGATSHNHFWFYRDAMEVSLRAGDWDEVERYAQALEDYTRSEPLPWSDFFIARGRTLSAYGQGRRDAEVLQELRRLREEAERVGLKTALPALDAALSEAGAVSAAK
jgi:class 3 adenylate cyclase/tetratricopeptide (TPR) repeat protein